MYSSPGAQLPLSNPKLPASCSRAHTSTSVCFFLVWVKAELSPLSIGCTCLLMIPPYSGLFSLAKTPIIFQALWLHIHHFYLLINLVRQE